MDIGMKVSLLMGCLKALENIYEKMVVNMKGISKMVNIMEKELKLTVMEMCMKESLWMS